ncbi:hypothetical protein [Chroococcidiopsis sp.]
MSLIGLTQAFYSATAINSKKRAIATHPLSVVSCQLSVKSDW